MKTNSLISRELEIRALYPFHSNAELAAHFGKSISKIKGFANYLELKKHSNYLSSLRSRLTTKQHKYGKGISPEVSLA